MFCSLGYHYNKVQLYINYLNNSCCKLNIITFLRDYDFSLSRSKRSVSPATAYGGKPWAFRPKSCVPVMYEHDTLREPIDADCLTEITGMLTII